MSKYSELLKDPRWQKRRLEILQQHNFTCAFCGDTKTTLHVHHFKYTGLPWEAPDENLCAICEDCHWLEHNTKNYGSGEKYLLEFILAHHRPISINRTDKSMGIIKALIRNLKKIHNGETVYGYN